MRINGDGSIRLLYSGKDAPLEAEKIYMRENLLGTGPIEIRDTVKEPFYHMILPVAIYCGGTSQQLIDYILNGGSVPVEMLLCIQNNMYFMMGLKTLVGIETFIEFFIFDDEVEKMIHFGVLYYF